MGFDTDSRSWEWEVAALQNLVVSDNVVDLLVNKISKLPRNTKESLKIAACLGNQFEMSFFNLITEQSAEENETIFRPAYQDGFLVQVNGSRKFAHDRIQQAVYSMIDNTEKVHLHHRIGQTMLQARPQPQGKYLFETVNHLNQATSLIQSKKQRVELARLNMKVAQNAVKAAAFDATEAYAREAIGLLGVKGWQDQYALMLELHQLAAEAAYLTQNFERSHQFVDTLRAEAHSPLDEIPAIITKMRAYHAQLQVDEVLELGFMILNGLGIALQESVPSGLSNQTISKLPLMSNQEAMAGMEVLEVLSSTCLISRFEQFPAVVNTGLDLTLKFGLHPASSFIHCVFCHTNLE